MNEAVTQDLESYLADPRISNSKVEMWRRDRAEFEADMNGHRSFVATDVMKFGNYFEDLLFNPSEVKAQYVIAPAREDDPDKVIHRGSREYKEFARGVAGQTIVMPAHANRAKSMLDRIAKHPTAARLVAQGRGCDQLVLRWTCPDTGLLLKGRPDRVIQLPSKPFDIILDLKTDLDPRDTYERRRRWSDRGYHRKMAGYGDGWREITGRNAIGFIVAVSNQGPVRCCVYRYDPDCPAILTGSHENMESLREIAKAMETGVYRYDEELEAVPGVIPPWAVSEAVRSEVQ